jgi:hypothetical protein
MASVTPSAGSPFAPPTTISPPERNADAPQVAIDQSGQAIAVWRDLGPSKPNTRGSNREPLLYATATLG